MRFFLNKWIIMLCILPFIKPVMFTYIPLFDRLFDIMRIISAMIIVISYLKNSRISKLVVLFFLYFSVIFISTFIHKGQIFIAFINLVTVVCLCMLIEIGIRNDSFIMIQSLCYLLSTFCYINFVLMIIEPDGICRYVLSTAWNMHFVAGKNQMGLFLVGSIIISLLYSYMRYQKIKFFSVLLIIINFSSLVISKTGTGKVGIALALVLIFISKTNRFKQIINYRTLFISAVITFFLIVIIRVQSIFSVIIEQILHKSITFTGRTDLWDLAIELIKESPLLGYGFQNGEFLHINNGVYSAHNEFLQKACEGGFISVFIFIMILIACGSTLVKYKEHIVSKIISIGIFSCLIMMMTESTGNTNLIYILMPIGYFCDELIFRLKSLNAMEVLHKSTRQVIE